MAARQLTAKARLSLTGVYDLTQIAAGESGASPTNVFDFSRVLNFANGTGADQAQRFLGSKGRTLSSTSENIDLFDLASLNVGAGAGLDSLGQAFAITGIKLLYVANASTSAVDLLVGGLAAATAWNTLFNADDDAIITLHPGASMLVATPKAAGYAVADSTNHLLKIEASGGAATYDIAVLGI